MKAHVSMKRFSNLRYCVRAGYCELDYLLRYHDPIYYNSGVYGWNCDIYCIDGLYITTGYRNMRGESLDWERVRDYEQKAKKIQAWESGLNWDEIKRQTSELLADFVSWAKSECDK